MSFRKIHNTIEIFLAVLVFWVLLFGFSQLNMGMSTMDNKASCLFGGHSMAICQMNPMEHIQEWQSMFTILPVQSATLALLAFFAFFGIYKFKPWSRISLSHPALLHWQRYRTGTTSFQILDPLQEAFSSGVLNPKVF